MTHYEERLEQDLAGIRERIVAVAAAVEEALERCIHALLTYDRPPAAEVVLGDLDRNCDIHSGMGGNNGRSVVGPLVVPTLRKIRIVQG